MPTWMNPSKSAELWDPDNNRHIRPNEKTTIRPSARLLMAGRMIELKEDPIADSSSAAPVVEPTSPRFQAPKLKIKPKADNRVIVTSSAIEIDEEPTTEG